MSKKVIEFKNFSFQYDAQQQPTLTNINLDIYENEKILIIGPSGSGKSTLGHLINGLIPFAYKGEYAGEFKINGQDAFNQTLFQRSSQIGTVLQDTDGQFVALTVKEDIAFSLENQVIPKAEMEQKVSQIATTLDLSDLLNHSPHELSGGQKQRTSLAGILINQVNILLFDEPLANLDPLSGETTIELIDQIAKTDKTVIIIEHRLEDVLYESVDRIILIDDGTIIADMDPITLLKSDLLAQHGIREPLYLTALKKAQVNLDEVGHLDNIRQLDLKNQGDKVVQWYAHHSFNPKTTGDHEVLKVHDISFSYDGIKPTLSHINLSFKEAEMVAIVGKNGAGKSTLAKCITQFEKIDEGQILILNQNQSELSIKEVGEKIGYVLQNPNQMISKNKIYDEIALGLRLRKIDEVQIKQRVEKVLKICGLSPYIDWPISALSYGQKKRVTIASILILEPKILILDEPTAGQDMRHYTEIMDFLKQLNQLGLTILFVTHDMHLILEYTNRAIVLTDGQIIADDKPWVVLGNSDVIHQANLKKTSLYTLCEKVGIEDKDSFVAKFIGDLS